MHFFFSPPRKFFILFSFFCRLARINVDSHDFGSICPSVDAIKSNPAGSSVHQLNGSFRLTWIGRATIKISTAVLVLSKSLPITAKITLSRIAGNGHYSFTKGPDPLFHVGFSSLPVIACNVETDFGSSLSISNLPKVGAYVSSKM